MQLYKIFVVLLLKFQKKVGGWDSILLSHSDLGFTWLWMLYVRWCGRNLFSYDGWLMCQKLDNACDIFCIQCYLFTLHLFSDENFHSVFLSGEIIC